MEGRGKESRISDEIMAADNMHKTKLTIFFAVTSLALFGVAGVASAAPDVTGVAGTISGGSTVTVVGTGFGTKTQANPISWDNFETHANGERVYNSNPIIGPSWTNVYGSDLGDEVAYSNERFHAGSISAKLRWLTNSIRMFGWSGQGPFTTFYVTWWGYQHWDSGHTDAQLNADALTNNRKWFYLFGNSSTTGSGCSLGAVSCPQALSLIPGGGNIWSFYNNSGVAGSTLYSDVTFADTHDRWQRWEYYFVLNTPYTASNGEVHFWLDAVKKITSTNYKHRYTDNQWRDFNLGYMWQGYANSADGAHVFIDDIYIDSTQARVEIGNAPTWSANTHREIQIPSEWSDSSVVATLNQGSFDTLEGKYLYVIDANGNVNANGYLLTTADTTPPSAPSGLVVN